MIEGNWRLFKITKNIFPNFLSNCSFRSQRKRSFWSNYNIKQLKLQHCIFQFQGQPEIWWCQNGAVPIIISLLLGKVYFCPKSPLLITGTVRWGDQSLYSFPCAKTSVRWVLKRKPKHTTLGPFRIRYRIPLWGTSLKGVPYVEWTNKKRSYLCLFTRRLSIWYVLKCYCMGQFFTYINVLNV